MSGLDFSFPLNVYAALLQWSEGQVAYLHYGLFEAPDEPVLKAQERASQHLWAQMPPTGRVLDVGIGMGTTLQRLRERGFDAIGITPEAEQARALQARLGADLPVVVTGLEDFNADTHGHFDVMVLQESAQYIQPLALFEAADRLLPAERSTLIVMDEFANHRESDADFGLHLLPHFKALARRYGWQIVHDADVTAQARLTIEVLQRLLVLHRERLLLELSLADSDLDGLTASLARYGDCYARGVYGYRVLRFERTGLPTLRPLPVDIRQPQPVLELFRRVFGHDMSETQWSWKYGADRGRAIAMARRDHSPVAFYGGLTRSLRLFGQPALGCQICDVMVDAGSHDNLARQGGVFQRVAATFLEAEIGFARRHAVGFGFPTRRALAVAERLGLYKRVDEMVQLRWPVGAPLPSFSSPSPLHLQAFDASALAADPALRAQLVTLWEAMALSATTSVVGVRDPDWLAYRYGSRPGIDYELRLLQVQSTDDPVGLIVLRRHADHLEVLDVVASADHTPWLITALRAEAAALPEPLFVKAWITLSHAHWLSCPDDGVVHDSLDLYVPANAHTEGVAPAALAGRWLLMAGDTDFR